MRIIKKVLRQNVVYWAPLSSTGRGGWLYAQPIEIKARWEAVINTIMARSTGQEWRPAYRMLTDRLLREYGRVWFGALADLPNRDPNQMPLSEPAYVIGVAGQIPDLRARNMLYEAYVGRQ